MKTRDEIESFYKCGGYLEQNPELHNADTFWKLIKLYPIIDGLVSIMHSNKTLKILDVGGGSGTLLKLLAHKLGEAHQLKIEKYLLDINEAQLNLQKAANPDAIRIIDQSIQSTGLGAGEIDLTLMIDVLEHVADPIETLKELRRISRYTLFKVPLENCLYFNFRNFITLGRARRERIERLGHIHSYSMTSLKQLLQAHLGQILVEEYSNAFMHWGYPTSEMNVRPFDQILNKIAALINRASPAVAALLFEDFALVLVESRR